MGTLQRLHSIPRTKGELASRVSTDGIFSKSVSSQAEPREGARTFTSLRIVRTSPSGIFLEKPSRTGCKSSGVLTREKRGGGSERARIINSTGEGGRPGGGYLEGQIRQYSQAPNTTNRDKKKKTTKGQVKQSPKSD